MNEVILLKKITLLSACFVVLDQILKAIVSSSMTFGQEITVIPHFFYLTNAHNEGGAWSILNGNVWFLILVGIVSLVAVYYFLIKEKNLSKLESFLYPLLIGGIVGNLIDRIFLGYVVDYLGFIFGSYYFPVFNLADMGIVLSILTMLGMSIKEEYLCKKSK